MEWGFRVKNNPAGVLLETMRQIRTKSPNITMTDLWAQILRCQPTETQKIVAGVKMLMDLSADAKASVRAYAPGDPEIFLAPFTKIDSFLNSHNLSGLLSNYLSHLDDSTLTALAFTDHVLELKFSNEQPGSTKEVREFVVSLDGLLEECLASNLSQELKDLFVKNLEALRQALIKYRLGGEAAVQTALDTVTGSIIRNKKSINDEIDDAQDLVEKTAGFMGKIEDLITRTQNLATLASPVMNVLLPYFK